MPAAWYSQADSIGRWDDVHGLGLESGYQAFIPRCQLATRRGPHAQQGELLRSGGLLELMDRSWSLSMRSRITPLESSPARNVKPTTGLRESGDGHTWVLTTLPLPPG